MKSPLSLVAGLLFGGFIWNWNVTGVTSVLAATSNATQTRAFDSHRKLALPFTFDANQGQTDRAVKFVSRGRNDNLFLTSAEAVLVLHRLTDTDTWKAQQGSRPLESPSAIDGTAVLRMKALGANPAATIVGLEELPGRVNYLVGRDSRRWQTGIATFAKVKYQALYPGVDLLYYGGERQLEYDLIVAPGANPAVIRLGFEGAETLRIDAQGNLVLERSVGTVVQKAPHVYQDMNGVRQSIPGAYVLKGRNEVGFQVARHDASKPLVIDPVLTYSTYLGGASQDAGVDVAVDGAGHVYLTGSTRSLDFPTAAPLHPSFSGGSLTSSSRS